MTADQSTAPLETPMPGLSHYALADQLLDTAEMNHEGQPADTNIAEAHVRALLAVAEQLEEIAGLLRGTSAAKAEPTEVRIDSVGPDDIVRHPYRFNGKAICIVGILHSDETEDVPEGCVRIEYRFSRGSAYQPYDAVLPADTLVTPLPTA